MKFDTAISLGLNCQSKYHILRILYLRKFGSCDGFSIRAAMASGMAHASCYFDWCVAPESAVARALNNRFEGIFQAQNLRIKLREDGSRTVIDDAYGCAFPHAFDVAGALTRQDLLASLPEINRKYLHVRSRTISLMSSEQSKLYVIYGNLMHAALINLFQALDRYDENYRILLVTSESEPLQNMHELPMQFRDRLIPRQINHESYPGHLSGWQSAFDDIELVVP